MIAMTEKPLVEVNENDPTITFDCANKQIAATVILTFDPIVGDLVAQTPLIAIPGSGTGEPLAWTVLWQVMPNLATLQSASFISDFQGVELGSTPPGITILTSGPVSPSEPGQSPTQWKVRFQNRVAGANSFNYTLFLQGTRIDEPEPRFLRHDPTIAVVPEPIG